uniref:Uncharacterized protein n=1 Tax=Sander lucioperca TaxID=283035 RepID=A0A8C9YD61_SANLU
RTGRRHHRRTRSPPPARLPRGVGHRPAKTPARRQRVPPTRAPRGGPRAALPAAERGGRRGDCSPSRGSSPAPLRNPAVHLGDLLRIWVRPGARFTPSPRIFKVHHLSGPIARAHAPPPRRCGRDGPVVRPTPRGRDPTSAGARRPSLSLRHGVLSTL